MTLPTRWLLAILVLAIPAVEAPRAAAQYMYVDADGDGEVDQMVGVYGPSNVDVYIVTDRLEDGAWAPCQSDTIGMSLTSYTVNLYCSQSAIAFTNVQNEIPGWTEIVPLRVSPYSLSIGYAGPALAPGKHKLFSFTAERLDVGFCGDLAIVAASCFSPPGVVTSFGSLCTTVEGDNVHRLGDDWYKTFPTIGCTDPANRYPTITCPTAVVGSAGTAITFQVSVADPDCGVGSFSPFDVPQGASVGPLGTWENGSAGATFDWTPSAGQVGEYDVRFAVYDPDPFNWYRQQYFEAATHISVRAANSSPVAASGGPYAGLQDTPIQFDGSGSSDPEGDPLTFAWLFGDGSAEGGPTPSHAYQAGGVYAVRLTVSDPSGLTASDQTSATVAGIHPMRVFTTAANRVTRLPNGPPRTCFEIEPLPGGSIEITDLDSGVAWLQYSDTSCGEVRAYPQAGKASHGGDADRNGVSDLEVCFGRDALSAIAACLPPGKSEVPLQYWSRLPNGDYVRGEIAHEFVLGNGSLIAAIAPNPATARSSVEFTTTKAGSASARLFDVRGRLVATVLETSSLGAGFHRIPAIGATGSALDIPSGVYFFRLVTEHDGDETRRVTILH